MTLTEAQYRAARSAGILYLLMAVTAPFALLYVPSKLGVQGPTVHRPGRGSERCALRSVGATKH